jgi:hypothetical protein
VLALRRIPRRTVARLLRRHFPVLLRQIYHLGVRIRGSRILYWKALLRVLFKNPDALEAFGHDCFYYYHLNRHADFVDRELAAYVSSPARDDELDQVIPGPSPAASPVVLPVVPRSASGSLASLPL